MRLENSLLLNTLVGNSLNANLLHISPMVTPFMVLNWETLIFLRSKKITLGTKIGGTSRLRGLTQA